jgi:predicted RNA methylase
MTHQNKGLSRNTIDKYYTSPETVERIIDIVSKSVNINYDLDTIIEPSAGNGAFIENIKKLAKNTVFIDIEPENSQITKADFLEYNPVKSESKIHVIGNPPFGRQSSLANKFIKHACGFADTVAFILPRSFKKESMRRHFPLNFHTTAEFDVPKNSFIVNGEPHDVTCVFQIWEKRDILREVPKREEAIKFKFVKHDETPDVSFRRVGVYAGRIDTETENKSPQSHYFIKLEVPVTDELISLLNTIEYKNKSDTVGPKSISKDELTREFNTVLSNS